MAFLHQPGTDILIVVDLSIEDGPDGLVFIGHWLMAGLQIDDAQSAVCQADSWRRVEACIVRTPMR